MSKPIYTYTLTFIYFLLSLIGILNHEIWLDESHHWLLAKNSTSIFDLIENARYEGHPLLWNILLHFISRFTSNPFWMQFLHIIISTSVVFIFLKKSPFTPLLKVLFIFGYFILFEYNLLSRNYMLGVLFIFTACSFYKNKKDKFIYFTILLTIAANIHAMFLIIASSIMFIEFYEFFNEKKFKFNKKYTLGWSIFIIGILISIIQIIPPSDNTYFPIIDEIPFSKKFTHGILSLYKGILIIPDFRTLDFWNTNFLINFSKPIASILLVLTYVFPIILFYKNKALILYAYIGILGSQTFFYVTQLSSSRYDGMLFIIIMVGLWIDYYYKPDQNKLSKIIGEKRLSRLKKSILHSILIIHFFVGLTSYSADIKYPFDNSKNIASLLEEEKLLNQPIVSFSCKATALSALINKNIYSLCINDYESYCNWKKKCILDTEFIDQIDKKVELYMKNNNQNITLVSSHPVYSNKEKKDNFKIKLLKKFEKNTILKSNNYYIYLISVD